MNSSSENKLRKLQEKNAQLKQHLDLPRIPVSESSQSLIKFATTTPDYLISQIWGSPPVDPFNPHANRGCCNIL